MSSEDYNADPRPTRSKPLKNRPLMSSLAFRVTAVGVVALFLVSCSHSGNSSSAPIKVFGGGGCYVAPEQPSDIIPVAYRSCQNDPTDPLYDQQWHLENCGIIGQDIRVKGVWTGNTIGKVIKGNGVRIAIVDDGLEIGHPDLAQNIAAGASYNYVNNSYSDPTPSDPAAFHGTAVAGVAGARDGNNIGVKGVAPRSSLLGYNLLANSTIENEANAMTRDAIANSVSSNSWGAPDGNGTLADPGPLWRSAIMTGLTSGRGGKGTVYVWAAGNGAPRDNSNYDGQANNRGIIAVAAVAYDGTRATYSEKGANLWASAPGGEFCGSPSPAITTVDRTGSAGISNSDYTQCFNGTSAATPVVSGVVALMLEANPNLGWRDVRMILAETARKNDPVNGEWLPSKTASYFSHKYGFGVVDAAAAVAKAATWINLPAEIAFPSPTSTPNKPIPADGCTAASDTIIVSASGISAIEFIEITFSAPDHTYSGDLEVLLTSPSGTVSRLAEVHSCANNECSPYVGWVFGSARHLGEPADGNWTLSVKDLTQGDTGTFQSWQIKFYGH